MMKTVRLELASWSKFRWSQHPKHHNQEPGKHMPSLHPAYQGDDGPQQCQRVASQLHGLVLTGLDIHNEHKPFIAFCLLQGRPQDEGPPVTAQWSSLFSLGALFQRYLSCCMVTLSWERVICARVDRFYQLLAFIQSICFGFSFGKGRGFLTHFQCYVAEKNPNCHTFKIIILKKIN